MKILLEKETRKDIREIIKRLSNIFGKIGMIVEDVDNPAWDLYFEVRDIVMSNTFWASLKEEMLDIIGVKRWR